MASNTVVAITGANRGIGLGLVEAYLARTSTTVVGIVRSQNAAAALKTAAEKFQQGTASIIHIVELNFSKVASSDAARETIVNAVNGLGHINILICSAGHLSSVVPAAAIPADELREAFEVNTIGPLVAFQTLWPLMEKGTAATGAPPKFIVLTSSLGSIGGMEPMPGGAYGPSKAAVNHIVKALHQQMAQSGLVSVALHPGWVQTNMGHLLAEGWNYAPGPPITIEESVKGVLKMIDEATRESTSGKFVTETGMELPW
jgi:NAD(P)-dependent dehydrogenase (short-subunit alcohol dehydrogenase family)